MFNWYGNHKIGVLGSANSGKTCLILSLIWNLQNYSSPRFNMYGDKEVLDVDIIKNASHDFQFEKHKNTFLQAYSWPEKTEDYSLATINYHVDGKLCNRHLTFLDIPGERMSDILMWQAKDYDDWVKKLEAFWNEEVTTIFPIMKAYIAAYKDPQNSFETLVSYYKKSIYSLYQSYLPITPSTFILTTQGKVLQEGHGLVNGVLNESHPIWTSGELIPVSAEWCQQHKREHENLCKLFIRYRTDVLKPLFQEVDSCDHFVFCVDILNILMTGKNLFIQTQNEFKTLIKKLRPSKICNTFNKIGRNPPRVAFIATKSDLLFGENKDRLKSLLDDFVHPLRYSTMTTKSFICSSCISSRSYQDKQGKHFFIGNDLDDPNSRLKLENELPEYWPRTWDSNTFNFTTVIAPELSMATPPKQINLDTIFSFVIEGNEC